MRTLSIRQPYAWLIVHGHKLVENRDWTTAWRGRFLIHAGSGVVKRDYREAVNWLEGELGIAVPDVDDLVAAPRGGLVGVATLTDVVTELDNPFFIGPYGWLLDHAAPLPFVACKGQLGWFDLPRPAALREGQ